MSERLVAVIVFVWETQWEIWLVNVLGVVSALRPPPSPHSIHCSMTLPPRVLCFIMISLLIQIICDCWLTLSAVDIARTALFSRYLSLRNNKVFPTNNRNYNQNLLLYNEEESRLVNGLYIKTSCWDKFFSWLSLSSRSGGWSHSTTITTTTHHHLIWIGKEDEGIPKSKTSTLLYYPPPWVLMCIVICRWWWHAMVSGWLVSLLWHLLQD